MTEADIIKNQSIHLRSKSMDWFLYDIGPLHERVKWINNERATINPKDSDEKYFPLRKKISIPLLQ